MSIHELRSHDPEELGQYRVIGVLGSGRQGTVYLGEDPSGVRVAIKVINEFYPDERNRRRLAREIQACRTVPAYCTARVLDADVTGNPPFVVTEFINGPSLDGLIRADGPLHGNELLQLAVGTATALIGIHEAGVIHRDFKPSNVLLAPDGPRVVDFGLSSYEDLERSTMEKPQGEDEVRPEGTPVYLAPELLEGAETTPSSDVYAWALTVAFAARGRASFSADTFPTLIYQILHTGPDLEGVPDNLRPLLREATQKDPTLRPTARDLRRRLLEKGGSSDPRNLADGFRDDEDLLIRYRRLGSNAQVLLRRAPMLGSNELLTPETAGLLLDSTPAHAAASLIELRGSGFVRGEGDRFHIADSAVRAFAEQRMVTEEPGMQQVILARLRLAAGSRTSARPDPTVSRDFWTLADRLGKRPYAASIAAIIRSPNTVPPLTIGIAGPWGAGKTSLMRMIREDLDPAGEEGEEAKLRLRGGGARLRNRDVLLRARAGGMPELHPEVTPEGGDGWRPTVWFNPWMYQSDEQLWAGLAQQIIKQVTARLTVADRERFWLELNLRRVDAEDVRRRAYRVLQQRILPLVLIFVLVAVLATGLVAVSWIWPEVSGWLRRVAAGVFSGSALALAVGAGARWWLFLRGAAGGTFDRLLKQPESVVSEPLSAAPRDPGYAARAGFLHLVQSDVPRVLDLVATEKRPLVVFVDDLDRCTSSQVTKVVEALNLFLAGEFPHCVFIVAMEPQAVVAHLESAYASAVKQPLQGGQFGWRFLEKVVQLPIWLPTTSTDRMPVYLKDLLGVQSAMEATVADPTVSAAEDGHIVDWLASEIRKSKPTLPTLREAAKAVQAKIFWTAGETLEPVTLRAFNRVFAELYGADVAYEALLASLPLLDRPNARTVKRYVNLFRFMTLVAHYDHAERGVLVPSARKLAKLAALHLRWPQYVTRLAETDGEGVTLLARLEKAARMGVPNAVSNEAPFLSGDDAVLMHDLLTYGEEIATEAQRFL